MLDIAQTIGLVQRDLSVANDSECKARDLLLPHLVLNVSVKLGRDRFRNSLSWLASVDLRLRQTRHHGHQHKGKASCK